MIKPEIGMPVLFHSVAGPSYAGVITHVWSGHVGVQYVDIQTFGMTCPGMLSSVMLHQGADGEPNPMGGHWCQFPNWFVRMLASIPVVFYPQPLIAQDQLARGPSFPPTIFAGTAVVPPGSVDAVQCGTCQPTSQVLG